MNQEAVMIGNQRSHRQTERLNNARASELAEA